MNTGPQFRPAPWTAPDAAPSWLWPVVLTLGVLAFVTTLGLRSIGDSIDREAQWQPAPAPQVEEFAAPDLELTLQGKPLPKVWQES